VLFFLSPVEVAVAALCLSLVEGLEEVGKEEEEQEVEEEVEKDT